MGPVYDRQAAPSRRRASRRVEELCCQGGVFSGRRRYNIIIAETIDPAVDKNILGEHISSRKRALKEARVKACAQEGARGGVHAAGCIAKHFCDKPYKN